MLMVTIESLMLSTGREFKDCIDQPPKSLLQHLTKWSFTFRLHNCKDGEHTSLYGSRYLFGHP